MVTRKPIGWTAKAKKRRDAILKFYRIRNGNSQYSEKILNKIEILLKYVSQNEEYGEAKGSPNIRSVGMSPFELTYKITKSKIIVVAFWDGRRNPDDLKVEGD